MKRRGETFVRLDATAERLLRQMTEGEQALAWIRARWDRIVGQPLSRKLEPDALAGRRLTVTLLDPSWRKPVEATLPELEAKLAVEVPGIKPKVVLR